MAQSGRPVDNATRQRIERLAREGRSVSETARQTNVARCTVRRVVESSRSQTSDRSR